MLSKLEEHNRILSYRGARYGAHPQCGIHEKFEGLHLQIITEYMAGVSVFIIIVQN